MPVARPPGLAITVSSERRIVVEWFVGQPVLRYPVCRSLQAGLGEPGEGAEQAADALEALT
jgi:hypothetical protein